jgi:hypothetical protein
LIPDGLSPANPSELGRRFRQFLKANHFSARAAVVGLPAKWLVARELTIPPAGANTLSGILQIQAERAFALDPKDLVFDYWRRTDSAASGPVLLMAAHRERINQISVLAKAAGLQLLAVTPTSHALRSIDNNNDSDVGIYMRDDYVEFWSPAAALPWIKHAARPARRTHEEHGEALRTEIDRMLWLSPGNEQGSTPHRVTLYAGVSLVGKATDELNCSLPGRTTIHDGNTNLLSMGFDADEIGKAGAAGPAAALALAASQDRPLFVDFLHPRMADAKRNHHARTLVWTALACVAIIAALVSVVRDWRQDIRDIATYTQQLDVMSDDIKAAEQMVDRMNHAARWTSRRPKSLEYLRQLTRAFPKEGAVWATTLRIGEDGQGSVIGKSLKEDNVLQLLDAIKKNGFFQNVQMLYMRDAGRDTDEVSFAITFSFVNSR